MKTETLAITDNLPLEGVIAERSEAVSFRPLDASIVKLDQTNVIKLVAKPIYRYVFNPQPDITTYELAKCLPFVVNPIQVVNKKLECQCAYLRHFEIEEIIN